MKYLKIVFSILFINFLFGQTPVGDQFQVNTSFNLGQRNASVAVNKDGNFVAVWQSNHSGEYNIYGQRFDSDGNQVGSEFLVNTTTDLEQSYPSVAIDSLGAFIVVWQTLDSTGADWEIYGQLYDASGNTVGSEFHVNTETYRYQLYPQVAMDRDGNFTVVWQSLASGVGIFMQQYDYLGNPVGVETQVNTYTNRENSEPQIAMNPNGQFAVAWQANYSSPDISARAFTASGVGLGDQIVVNQYTTNYQTKANVDIDDSGNFIVVWQSDGQDGSGLGVYGRRFDNAMNAIGNDFVLSTTTDSIQRAPDVVLDNNGEVTAFWEGYDASSMTLDVYYKRFDDANGVLVDETLLSTEQSGNQGNVSVGKNS